MTQYNSKLQSTYKATTSGLCANRPIYAARAHARIAITVPANKRHIMPPQNGRF